MTELRDARLRWALQAAPDAQARPPQATREAVRAAAAQALRKPRAQPWWKRVFVGSGERMPWNAAFATLALATLVTVLWQGQEVPGLREEPAGAVPAEAPAAGSSAPAPAPAQPSPTPAPVPGQQDAAAAAAKGRQAKAADEQRQRKAEPPVILRGQGAPEPAVQDQAAAREEAPVAAAAPGPAAPQAPAPGLAQAPAPAPPPVARALPASPAPAPAPAPEREQAAALAAQRARAESAARSAQVEPPRFSAAADWRQWSQVRVASDGRAVVLQREQVPELARAVEQLASAAGDAPGTQQLPLRLEFRHQGAVLAVLEADASQMRWSVRGQPPRGGAADPALLQALQAEAGRLLPAR